MRIETQIVDSPVLVGPSGECVELGIGEACGAGRHVSMLSIPQAEMVLHALGFAIAEIRERQRRADEERAHLARVVLDT